MGPDQPKASPLAKRIARPPQGPPAPKAGHVAEGLWVWGGESRLWSIGFLVALSLWTSFGILASPHRVAVAVMALLRPLVIVS